MNIRTGKFSRVSNETRIEAEVTLEGSGVSQIDTGIGFFDHMLELFTMHGGFDINLSCRGDLEVDGHHTVEDAGIVLGKAFDIALGERRGIARYGTFFVPMDESLAMASIDIGGRPYLYYQTPELNEKVGQFDTQLAEEFFRAFAYSCGIGLHVRVLYGRNTHHMLEAVFKAFGRALKQAAAIVEDTGRIPSTKGIMD
ncbi:MAG: imidazoleglycerol-phosphate dehydratase HisB [Clostridiales bacterium]|jgi:imidazoleglycerol-phosphate dehydratase|nr:imidazoleglycerol-phosphate dehydratase HisB [Clostridiales bacterium]